MPPRGWRDPRKKEEEGGVAIPARQRVDRRGSGGAPCAVDDLTSDRESLTDEVGRCRGSRRSLEARARTVYGVRILMLFTRDLRVHDHPALDAACRVADEIVPLFVTDPKLMALSPNRSRFLAESLIALDRALAHRGGRLVVREGDPATEAAAVAARWKCDRIHLTNDAGATGRARLARLRASSAAAGIDVAGFPGHAVHEPGELVPQGREAYRVFTPYLAAWRHAERRSVLRAPRSVRSPAGFDAGRLPDPSAFRPTALLLPQGGEDAGRKRLHAFIRSELGGYASTRDDLVADGTSRLSPYLRFGCVSANEMAAALAAAAPERDAGELLRQLAWRDYFFQLLAADPSMTWRDLRRGAPGPSRDGFDEGMLQAWKLGLTGFPLVDAGMRQLLREGWMHNRARLVAASFLTRRAGVPWQEGARHFQRHLVDGDAANNAGNWQWVAGTGTAPRRGRALSPVRQAQRFDPNGAYVRRYVEELAGVEPRAILRPWLDPALLRATGYPAPVAGLETELEGTARSTVPAAPSRSVPR